MKMFTKVIKVLYNTLMTIIIILGIAFAVAFAIGIRPFIVESGSMEPTLHVGSVCFVNTKIKYEDIKVNDIIAFKSKIGMRVTHRVVSVSEDGFETKGDANESKDGPIITKDEYMGKTIFSIPNAGVVVKFIQKPIGLIMTGILILIIFLIGMLLDSPSEEDTKNNEKQDDTKN